MNFLQFRWVFVLICSLGLTLTGCGAPEEATDKTAMDSSAEATDTVIAETETEGAPESKIEGTKTNETKTGEEATKATTPDAAPELTPAPDGTFAASIQEVLMTSFPEQTGFEVEMVACPEEATLESGEPFACQVLATDGFVTLVDVVTDPEAKTFDWTTKGLDIRGLEKAIATGMLENLELTGEVDCGLGDEKNPFREEAVGAAFDCTFVAEGGEEQAIEVVVNDEKGNVTWNLK